jgi:hypothetical protein
MVPDSLGVDRHLPTGQPLAHTAVVGVVTAAALLASVAVVPRPFVVLVAGGVCMGATVLASEQLQTRADGERSVSRKDSCGCGTLEQERIDVELRERDRLIGWCCGGAAGAAALVVVALLVL